MFNPQPTLSNGDLTLKPLAEADRAALAQAASDPLIWELHPSHTRHLPEVFDPYFDYLIGMNSTLIAQKVAKRLAVLRITQHQISPTQFQ